MKRSSESSPLGFYTIGIAALFLAGFLLLVVFGAQSYRDTVALQDGNMQTRAILSYLATTVRANDTAGSVTVRDGEDGQVLVVEDGGSGYALRIYRRDGRLLEDFAALDAELDPEKAEVIGATETFDIEQLPGGVLRVDTDEGSVLLHVRSGERGGAS